MDWLTGFTDWILSLVRQLWTDVIAFLTDLWIGIVQTILVSVADLIAGIPVPGFMETYSLGGILSALPSDVLYFVGFLNLPEAFGLIGMGLAFRMVRKVITLFQW